MAVFCRLLKSMFGVQLFIEGDWDMLCFLDNCVSGKYDSTFPWLSTIILIDCG